MDISEMTAAELEEAAFCRRMAEALAEVEPFPDPLVECFDRAGVRIHVKQTSFGTIVYRMPWNQRCERCPDYDE